MARSDSHTLIPGDALFLHAEVGQDLPDDLFDIDTAVWEEFGHTSIESILSMESDGGEATSKGTMQNRNLRTTYAPRTEAMNFILQQFDEDSLKFYLGANSELVAGGRAVASMNRPVPSVRALCIVLYDGDNALALWAPKAEIMRGDDLSLEDPEEFAGMNIRVTPMNFATNKWSYAITPVTPRVA